MTILVTGGTGKVGSQVVRFLAQRNQDVRVAVHAKDKVSVMASPRICTVHFDYTDPASMERALDGVEKVYLLTPAVTNAVEMATRAIDIMRHFPLQLVVRQSVLQAGQEPGITITREHRRAEQALEASGLPYTFLRPNSFMENLYGMASSIRQGIFPAPMDDARVSYIATQDIGEAAAVVLTTPGHAGQAYDLTGPEALSGVEIAQLISEASQHPVRYQRISDMEFREAMAAMPDAANRMAELYASYRAGQGAELSPWVQQLTGHPPMTLRYWLRDHASAFRPESEQAA